MPDEAGREMAALLADLDPALARPLTSYIGLFRSRTTQLGWDRALRLAREALALVPAGDTGQGAMQTALSMTVTAMDEKRASPGWKPLTSHQYLMRVLESVVANASATPVSSVPALASALTAPAKPGLQSFAGQALASLQSLRRTS